MSLSTQDCFQLSHYFETSWSLSFSSDKKRRNVCFVKSSKTFVWKMLSRWVQNIFFPLKLFCMSSSIFKGLGEICIFEWKNYEWMWKQYCISKVLLALQEHQKPSNVTICYLKMKSGFLKILVQKLSEKIPDIPKSLLEWDEKLWTIKATLNFLQ